MNPYFTLLLPFFVPSCLRGSSSPGRRAYTLTELLVVMGIIALVTAMGVATFGPFMEGRQLEAGASTVQAMVARTRAYAAANRTKATLRVDPDTGALEVFDVPTTGRERVAQPEYLPENVDFDTSHDDWSLEGDPESGGADVLLVFHPSGMLDPELMGTSSAGIVIKETNGDRSKKITVIFSSGLTKIEDL